jgi:Methylase involved in ubiquinone/menaquinone biosynthesis
MAHRVCPWWIGYFLASPIRRLIHNPSTILGPFVASGMTVLELGPGMGFFTLELARLVGPTGHVIAVDVQPRMLKALRRRAEKARLIDRIDIRQAPAEGMGVEDINGKVDFVLAFAVVHEVPDEARFFREATTALRRGCKLLLSEPAAHVTEKKFAATLQTAERCGLRMLSRLDIRSSHSVVLLKT